MSHPDAQVPLDGRVADATAFPAAGTREVSPGRVQRDGAQRDGAQPDGPQREARSAADGARHSEEGGRSPSSRATTGSSAAAILLAVPKVRYAARRTSKSATAVAAARRMAADHLPALVDPAELTREAPAWLVSAILHMAVLLILALLLVTQQRNDGFVLVLDPGDSGEALQPGELDLPLDFDEPLPDASDLASAESIEMEAAEMFAATEINPAAPMGLQPAASASPVRMSLSGREEGMRESLLKAYGGTGSTQEAVTEALRWLARNQDRRSGLWSLVGPYDDGAAGPENRDAATAMALIAFQGAGYTPSSDRKDPFTAVTQRGWTALLKRQGKDGRFFTEGSSHGRLYTHGMATIAICELYGMTGDSAYREPAQRAVQYCIETQAAEGGWRYTPGVDSDTSVTGWFVMALQSAQMAGLDVPSETLTRISDYLDLVSRDGGSQYAYVPSQGKKLSMTAEGLLCRQYLGWKHSDRRLQKGADLLIENLPSWEADQRDVYYWYYASQVCHHMEGKHWRAWNEVMRRVLPEHQVREGRERGSWDPAGDRWGPRGGRLFVTCLSTYMLEVYYRHLPIYQLDLLSR